jgi:hypothetical protein
VSFWNKLRWSSLLAFALLLACVSSLTLTQCNAPQPAGDAHAPHLPPQTFRF